jgi:SAM-dependent MidA family methyltransferase
MPDVPHRLDAEATARVRRILDRLHAVAGENATLPFDRFMEVVLYERDLGFYERARSPLGTDGDFYTAAHVTPLFAETIAQRIREIHRGLGSPDPFWIAELGPGDGTLADGIVASFDADPPGIEYRLVDRSSARLRETNERLATRAHRVPVRSAESLGALGPFTGVVIANEFLDAQPARRLRWSSGAWHELGVRVNASGVEPTELPLDRPVPGRSLPTPTDDAVTLEVSPAAEGTVREVADHLVLGAAIFLDYGFDEPEIFEAHPHGTLAGVREHRFVPDPLADPGTVDLSTFVNFSRVRDAARVSGLRELSYRPQTETLGAWGFPALREAAIAAAPSAEARVRVQLATKNLLFGFERFRVLELAPASRPTPLPA